LFCFWNKMPTNGWRENMDVTKIVSDLRQERLQIEEAIVSLERLGRGSVPRRGRPPAWLAEQPKRRGRPPGSKSKSSTNATSEKSPN
jgi:hypothetical protein